MILNIIFFKNLKINAFTNPNFTDVDPEKAAKGLERSLIANFEEDRKMVECYKNLDMYYVGTFNDETGEIKTVEPVFLLSPREIVLQLMAAEISKVSEVKPNENESAN